MKYRVNIDLANQSKDALGAFVNDWDPRVLNRLGAFASLFAIDVREYKQPVLVLLTSR